MRSFVGLLILFLFFQAGAVFHKNARTTQVHTPFRWVFADSAEMATESVTADDTDKVAYRLSDSSTWVLRDNSPKTWVRIADGRAVPDSARAILGSFFSVQATTTNSDAVYTDYLNVSGDTSYTAQCSLYVGSSYISRGTGKFLIRNKTCWIMFSDNIGGSISSTNTDTVFVRSSGAIPASYSDNTYYTFSCIRNNTKIEVSPCKVTSGKLALLSTENIQSYYNPFPTYYFHVNYGSVSYPLP